MVWVAGGGLAAVLLGALILIVVILSNGLVVFWPAPIEQVRLDDGTQILGRRINSENSIGRGLQVRFKTANREFDSQRQDFHWVADDKIASTDLPAECVVLERLANGDFYGFVKEIKSPGLDVKQSGDPFHQLQDALRSMDLHKTEELDPLLRRIEGKTDELNAVKLSRLKGEYRQKQLRNSASHDEKAATALEGNIAELKAVAGELQKDSERLVNQRSKVEESLRQNLAIVLDAQGASRSIALMDVIRVYRPNSMNILAKASHYAAKVWELLTTPPREANTEGGVLPAIFGTVALVLLMAVLSFPLGVLAGVYLGEYARDGFLVRLVRIGVNNLAGIPSIVYGIFGVGFFINSLGHAIDEQFYAYRLAEGRVFHGGGVLWAALTLGILTVPVVIVATEEAIRVIPRGVRESSYALGSTKFQTLIRVLLPLASPGIMTGFILAMARAAGEVAPLMLTGVVSTAGTVPLDGRFPYLHLERQFLHLGFQIYTVAFQTPNSEAARPMVYVITLLLVLIVLLLSGMAILLRNRMRKQLQIKTI